MCLRGILEMSYLCCFLNVILWVQMQKQYLFWSLTFSVWFEFTMQQFNCITEGSHFSHFDCDSKYFFIFLNVLYSNDATVMRGIIDRCVLMTHREASSRYLLFEVRNVYTNFKTVLSHKQYSHYDRYCCYCFGCWWIRAKNLKNTKTGSHHIISSIRHWIIKWKYTGMRNEEESQNTEKKWMSQKIRELIFISFLPIVYFLFPSFLFMNLLCRFVLYLLWHSFFFRLFEFLCNSISF